MSFGKAKRFNYKPPDPTPSPADYSVSSKFDRGISISNSARFRVSSGEKKNHKVICPRMVRRNSIRSSTSTSEGTLNSNNSLNLMKDKITYFNRNDVTRQSFRGKPFKDRQNLSVSKLSSLQYQKDTEVNDFRDNMNKEKQWLYDSDEFIDDDYGSLTSSDELDQLKKVEEYEFNEVCNALQRMQEKESLGNSRASSFEDVVLDKLDYIERNVENFKDDFAKLHENNLEKQERHRSLAPEIKMEYVRNYDSQICFSLSEKQDEIQNAVTKAFENLGEEFDEKRKSILNDNEIKIKKLVNEIYDISEKTGGQIKNMCTSTAKLLSENLCKSLRNNFNPTLQFNRTFEKEEIKCNPNAFNYENIYDIFSDQLQQRQEANESMERDSLEGDSSLLEGDTLEGNNLDVTLKYANTKQMLDIQGSIIEVLRIDLEDLKQCLS